MEDTLRATLAGTPKVGKCLNPCFNGRYSQSICLIVNQQYVMVLILVLMEDTLRETNMLNVVKSVLS